MIARIVTAVLGILGISILVALSAYATEGVEPAAPWVAIDTGPGPYAPDVPRNPSAHTTIVDPHTAELMWVAGETDSELGTSLETSNLGIDVAAGDVISVDYELMDGASPAAGAVRLFVYSTPIADTLTVAPDQFAAAPDDGSTSGILSIVAGSDFTIGSAGLVYDTSNGGVEGTVRFTNLTVGEISVVFAALPIPCEWDSSLLADDPECVEPEASPSPTPTVTATADPSPTSIPVASSADTLPATGSRTVRLGVLGAALVLFGAGALMLRRAGR